MRDSATIGPVLSIAARLDLPFCPREMALNLDGSKLIVADAFSGRLAVVDVKTSRTIESVRSLPAHNIRGLALAPDGKTLVVAHQVQSRLAQSSFDDVHWGLLIRNHLRVLQIDSLLRPGPTRRCSIAVGYSTLAMSVTRPATPAMLRLMPAAICSWRWPEWTSSRSQQTLNRRRAALSSGVGQPLLCPALMGSLVYVADSLDDTISVVEIASGLRPATIALGPRPRIDLGRPG